MNKAVVDWNFHDHSGTSHGFTVPPTLGHPWHLRDSSDRRSTVNMLSLFKEIFHKVKQNYVSTNAAGNLLPE